MKINLPDNLKLTDLRALKVTPICQNDAAGNFKKWYRIYTVVAHNQLYSVSSPTFSALKKHFAGRLVCDTQLWTPARKGDKQLWAKNAEYRIVKAER